MAKKGGLNDKQRLFAAEYLKDFNATQAAARAGYSKKTAYSIGQENLKKPVIMVAVERYGLDFCVRLGRYAEAKGKQQ